MDKCLSKELPWHLAFISLPEFQEGVLTIDKQTNFNHVWHTDSEIIHSTNIYWMFTVYPNCADAVATKNIVLYVTNINSWGFHVTSVAFIWWGLGVYNQYPQF